MEIVSELNSSENQTPIFRIARQMLKERQVPVAWKIHRVRWLNENNEWDHDVSSSAKEGPADCIMIPPVISELKDMKNHKAQAYSGW